MVSDEVFGLFEDLIQQGKVAALGVSIEKVDEGIRALDYAVVSSIQVIVNLFRQKPVEELFELAEEKNVGLIVRVPLASGLLTGKITSQTTFDAEDHRFFNREGKAFDKGETFSGVPLDLGFAAVEELKIHFSERHDLGAQALRWVLMHRQVSTVIPGASSLASGRPEHSCRSIASLESQSDARGFPYLRAAHQSTGTRAVVSTKKMSPKILGDIL